MILASEDVLVKGSKFVGIAGDYADVSELHGVGRIVKECSLGAFGLMKARRHVL